MEYPKCCFFCCKYIIYDLKYYGDHKDTDKSITGFINYNKTSPFEIKADIKSILRISQYLKVPRNLVAQLKERNDLVPLSVCGKCGEISKTLSKLCRDVEVTKMKISHYLNLLTDRIIGINDDNEQKVNKEEIQFSELQKDIHKKCLLKVRKLEDKAIPQVILTNCHVGPSQPLKFELNDFEQDEHPIVLESDEHQIKTVLSADDNPELQTCPFCNFTVNCGDQLQVHITDQHFELFESYTTIHPNSDSTVFQTDLPKKTALSSNAPKRNLIKCKICGMMILSKNIGRHNRNQHKFYPQQNISSTGAQTQVKCDFCLLTFKSVWHKETHTKAMHLQSSHPNWDTLEKTVPSSNQSNMPMENCEICGLNIQRRNLRKHKQTQHKVGSQENQSIQTRRRTEVKCDFCPLTFATVWNKDIHTKSVHLLPTHQLIGRKKLKRCEICGAMVAARHFPKHKKIRHENINNKLIRTEIGNRIKQPKRYKCVVCGNGYALRRSLWRHYRKSEKCGMQNEVEIEKMKLDRQIEMSTTDTVIKAENDKDTTLDSNSDHLDDFTVGKVDLVKNSINLKSTWKNRRKKCQICGAMIKGGNFAKHVRVKHGDVADKYICFRSEPKNKVKCDFCPLTFTSDWNKKGHTKAVHLRPANQLVGEFRVIKCEICEAMVAVRNLAAHKRMRHKNNGADIETGKSTDEKIGFKCAICGNGYASPQSLFRHCQTSEKCRMEKELRMKKKKRDGYSKVLNPTEIIIKDEKEVVVENLLENVEDPLKMI